MFGGVLVCIAEGDGSDIRAEPSSDTTDGKVYCNYKQYGFGDVIGGEFSLAQWLGRAIAKVEHGDQEDC